MTKELMEQVLDALITYRDFIDNAHIIEGQFHWLEGTEDAIKALEEALKQEQSGRHTHDLYTDADKDRPVVICDKNGQVVLSLCKSCGRGESELETLCDKTKQEQDEPKCKTHPDAPHGFVRNASHSEDRYVCECEFWEPPEQDEPVAYINVEQRKLEWAKYTSWETPTVVNLPKIPLYTKPQNKEWVGLTEDDKVLIKHDANYNQFMTAGEYADRVQALTEARLKDKNAL